MRTAGFWMPNRSILVKWLLSFVWRKLIYVPDAANFHNYKINHPCKINKNMNKDDQTLMSNATATNTHTIFLCVGHQIPKEGATKIG